MRFWVYTKLAGFLLRDPLSRARNGELMSIQKSTGTCKSRCLYFYIGDFGERSKTIIGYHYLFKQFDYCLKQAYNEVNGGKRHEMIIAHIFKNCSFLVPKAFLGVRKVG